MELLQRHLTDAHILQEPHAPVHDMLSRAGLLTEIDKAVIDQDHHNNQEEDGEPELDFDDDDGPKEVEPTYVFHSKNPDKVVHEHDNISSSDESEYEDSIITTHYDSHDSHLDPYHGHGSATGALQHHLARQQEAVH